MIVTRASFHTVVAHLVKEALTTPIFALDTETTGLRPYHGDRMFSLIIADNSEAYYFNFLPYENLDSEFVIPKSWLPHLQPLFDKEDVTWFLHNAKYDMHILSQDLIELSGTIHCTMANGRIEYNDHMDYDLEASLERIGRAKDDAVKKFIMDNKLYTTVSIPGRVQKKKLLHFDKVPFKIIAPYGETDGAETRILGLHQIKSIEAQDNDKKSTRKIERVLHNERRLTKTVFRMERKGVLIDRDYCTRAQKYEMDKAEKALNTFKRETGKDFSASPKLFAEVFAEFRDLWSYTEKGNPSFDSKALAKFKSPASNAILAFRDSKSKADFYSGFLYHADSNGVVHPNFNQNGASHGRFSSSDPNFQNLTSEEEEDQIKEEFIVRRAIIPRPGYIFIMPDYDQMEYRFMLEMACILQGYESELVKLVKSGIDVHEATANVASLAGITIKRSEAKTSNFLTLYGGGDQKLADGLGCSLAQASKIRGAIFRGAPEIGNYIYRIQKQAKEVGFITNWLGRRCYFPNRNRAYKAPNYHISGGCADVVKVAMNKIDDYLLGKRSNMVMTVHDELPIEIHENELAEAPYIIKEIMENVFPHKYIPLTTGMEWSAKSLGDKVKGFPV